MHLVRSPSPGSSSFEEGFERLTKVTTTRHDGGTQSLRASRQTQVSTWKLCSWLAPAPIRVQCDPHPPLSPPWARTGSRPRLKTVEVRRPAHGDAALSSGPACTDRQPNVHSRPCKEASRRSDEKEGDGGTVTAGGISVKTGRARWDGDHPRHDADEVTRRPTERGVGPQRHRPRSPTGWRSL